MTVFAKADRNYNVCNPFHNFYSRTLQKACKAMKSCLLGKDKAAWSVKLLSTSTLLDLWSGTGCFCHLSTLLGFLCLISNDNPHTPKSPSHLPTPLHVTLVIFQKVFNGLAYLAALFIILEHGYTQA